MTPALLLNFGRAGIEIIKLIRDRAKEPNYNFWPNFVRIDMLEGSTTDASCDVFDLQISIDAVRIGDQIAKEMVERFKSKEYQETLDDDLGSIDVVLLVDGKDWASVLRRVEKVVDIVENMDFVAKSIRMEMFVLFTSEYEGMGQQEVKRLRELVDKTSSLRKVYFSGDVDSNRRYISIDKRNQVVADFIFLKSISHLSSIIRDEENILNEKQLSKVHSIGLCELTCPTERIMREKERASLEFILQELVDRTKDHVDRYNNREMSAFAEEFSHQLTIEGSSGNSRQSLSYFRDILLESRNDSYRSEIENNLRFDKKVFSKVNDIKKLPGAMLNLFVYTCEVVLPKILARLLLKEKEAEEYIWNEIDKRVDGIVREQSTSFAKAFVTSLNQKIEQEKKMRITNIAGSKKDSYGNSPRSIVGKIWDLHVKINTFPRRSAYFWRSLLLSTALTYVIGTIAVLVLDKWLKSHSLQNWVIGASMLGAFITLLIVMAMLNEYRYYTLKSSIYRTHFDCIEEMSDSVRGIFNKGIQDGIDRLLESASLITADPDEINKIDSRFYSNNEHNAIRFFEREIALLPVVADIEYNAPKPLKATNVDITSFFTSSIDTRYDRLETPNWASEATYVYKELASKWREGKAFEYLSIVVKFIEPKLLHIKRNTLGDYISEADIELNEAAIRKILDRIAAVASTCFAVNGNPRDVSRRFVFADGGQDNNLVSLISAKRLEGTKDQVIDLRSPYSSFFINVTRHESEFIWEELPILRRRQPSDTPTS